MGLVKNMGLSPQGQRPSTARPSLTASRISVGSFFVSSKLATLRAAPVPRVKT